MHSASSGLRHPASASCLGRHSRLAGRCPNNSSLFPPLAAVVVVAAERIVLNFGFQESLRTFLKPIFTGGVGTNSLSQSLTALTEGVPPQKKAVCQTADSLFQKKIRKTRAQKGRVSIRTYFRPCSARCARTAPIRLRSRHGRRCAPDT